MDFKEGSLVLIILVFLHVHVHVCVCVLLLALGVDYTNHIDNVCIVNLIITITIIFHN